MASVVASGMSLKVHLPASTFATREDAPAPTVDAFVNRHEPLFFDQATFTPFRRATEVEPVATRPRRGLFSS